MLPKLIIMLAMILALVHSHDYHNELVPQAAVPSPAQCAKEAGKSGELSTEDDLQACILNSASCLALFDADNDHALKYVEFGALCAALFRNESGASYPMAEADLRNLFDIFNPSNDGLLTGSEWEECWAEWVVKILRPVSALLVIDVQNDFINGSLALREGPAGEDGEEVVAPINSLTATVDWAHVYFSQDWHPPNHISFLENVGLRHLHPTSPLQDPAEAKVGDVAVFETKYGPMQQILWPAHCVPGSWGAELHEDLVVPPGSSSTMIQKGQDPDVDSYSAFWDNGKLGKTELHTKLQALGVTDVFVCGLAYDICVGFTAMDALQHGYRTVIVDDASRALDLDRKHEIQTSILNGHGAIVQVATVKEMVEGKDRRPELGIHLAQHLQSLRSSAEAMTILQSVIVFGFCVCVLHLKAL